MSMISALTFCPKNKVTAAFDTLSEIILDEAIPIMDYFEDTYIGKPHRRCRRSPIFDIDIWNMYSRDLDYLPKSNNSVEGWHHSFQSNLTSDHPNNWVFPRILQKEQGFQDAIREQMSSGHSSQIQKKKYKDISLRIKNIVATFDNCEILEYLRSI